MIKFFKAYLGLDNLNDTEKNLKERNLMLKEEIDCLHEEIAQLHNALNDERDLLNASLDKAKELQVELTELRSQNFENILNDLDEYLSTEEECIEIPDNIAVYVDDLAGGKVIKQEANKCIKITKDGEVEEGYTKRKCDKGHTYKLIREKQ